MSPDDADTATIDILDKISSPFFASLLSTHPNDVTLQNHERTSHWSSWWTWASDLHPGRAPAWCQLMHYFLRSSSCGPGDGDGVDIPPQLCSLADSVRSLQLQRTPLAYETCHASDRSYRISPKKEHEVDRMSSYIRHMVHSEGQRSVWHAVDVGSGQGYLSRALQELDFHVLALDNNENQTSGANRWTSKEAARKSKEEHRETVRNTLSRLRTQSIEQEDAGRLQRFSQTQVGARYGSLTHRTVHVCPRTLEESVARWLDSSETQRYDDLGTLDFPTRRDPVPVTFVALHACGSLTVDVLRTFLSNRVRTSQAEDVERAWKPHSLVVVGCCYNLMSPSDFPLSKALRDMHPTPKLTIAAVHLAAQIPSQWLKNEKAVCDAELALRKVVYRALLQPILQAAAAQLSAIPNPTTSSERPIQSGLGETLENRRLGKLNNKAYQDWPTFLDRATEKMGIDLGAITSLLPDWLTHEPARLKMERALFVLQTLRCILGPLIETLILLDRRNWIQQELSEMNECGKEVEVDMVNLFDQSTGSGRNVALVVRPAAHHNSAEFVL